MIIKEQINEKFIRHYSDTDFKIQQVETGLIYEEAIDLISCGYTYVETEEKIDVGCPNYECVAEHYKTLLDTVSGETGDEE